MRALNFFPARVLGRRTATGTGKTISELVNPRDVLDKIDSIPVSTWRWIGEDAGSRHMGAMAQDFYAAFHLGADDRHIVTVDADGVALAGIQGLHQLVQEKDARIAALEQEVSELQTLRGELAALKAMVTDMASANGKVANR